MGKYIHYIYKPPYNEGLISSLDAGCVLHYSFTEKSTKNDTYTLPIVAKVHISLTCKELPTNFI